MRLLVSMKSIWNVLNYELSLGKGISLTLKDVLILLIVFFVAKYILTLFESVITKRLDNADDKNRFSTVFSFSKWLMYAMIFFITLSIIGVNLTAVFASAAALLIGVGLALQTWFQDIMSGIFIILDKSLRVGDIIEINSQVGRVQEIRLRTTRAVTIDNKVLIIPNHLYLTSTLFNWTQNGKSIKATINIGVGYDSDLNVVKKLLIQAVKEHPDVVKGSEVTVFFNDFGDNALSFSVFFSLNDCFSQAKPKSDIRFRINELFRDHEISIPFPQRDVHLINQK